MKQDQKKLDYVDNLSTMSQTAVEQYTAPDIEIIDIEVEQNILQSGSGDLPGMPGEGW